MSSACPRTLPARPSSWPAACPSPPTRCLRFQLQQQYGVHLGSVVSVPFYALSRHALWRTESVPERPAAQFPRGRHRGQLDGLSLRGDPCLQPLHEQSLRRAARAAKPSALAPALVRLRHGAADLPRFQVAFNNLPAWVPIMTSGPRTPAPPPWSGPSIPRPSAGGCSPCSSASSASLSSARRSRARACLEAETYPTLEASGFSAPSDIRARDRTGLADRLARSAWRRRARLPPVSADSGRGGAASRNPRLASHSTAWCWGSAPSAPWSYAAR